MKEGTSFGGVIISQARQDPPFMGREGLPPRFEQTGCKNQDTKIHWRNITEHL